MSIYRLIYASKVSESVKEKDIQAILETANTKNKALNVTGGLFFNYKYFLQCLEGSRENVSSIYHAIVKDTRHELITMIDFQEIQQRDFSQWSMAYLSHSTVNNAVILEYSSADTFNPFEMTSDSCYRLMLQLRESAPQL